MEKTLSKLICGLGLTGSLYGQTALTGPNSSQSPYMTGAVSGSSVVSLMTSGDSIGTYKMCGLGDGMGAFDNNDGTITLLLNHEIGATSGAVRAHGQKGAFVSKWIMNKNNMALSSGSDLIQNVHLWANNSYTMFNATNPSTLTAFGRFCAADLPAVSAFYNSANGKGTTSRIFMNGEESGAEGRAFAHISSGIAAGNTYELPYLGKFSWENSVASPYESDKTVVVGLDDATPGQVYFYIGTKTTTGTDIEKAGLSGGKLYGVSVNGMAVESSTLLPSANTPFALVDMGQVQNMTGSTLNTNSNNMGVTAFLRPEDGAWDPSKPNDFYFVTTNSFSSPSRLWRLRFYDKNNPEYGGTITAVLDGTEGQKMFDNLVMDGYGQILLQEDPGGQTHTAKVWQYHIATDALTLIMDQDPNRFVSGGSSFITLDEESSGIIDVQGMLSPGWFILYDQAHSSRPLPMVEAGQMLAFYNPATAAFNPEIEVTGNNVTISAGDLTPFSADYTDFQLVNTGTSVQRKFVINNAGPGPLHISGYSIKGANASEFTFVGAPGAATVNAGSSLTITVQFMTSAVATRTAMLYVYNNDASEPTYNFALQASGAAPEISLEGNNQSITDNSSSVSPNNNTDFGQVILNTASTRVYSIRNTGNGTLTINNLQINGPNSSAFSFVALPQTPLVLTGLSSATFAVQFMPQASGIQIGIVNIANTDNDEAAYDFVISGDGLSDVGIAENNNNIRLFEVFPNPASDEVSVMTKVSQAGTIEIKVIDLLGKVVVANRRYTVNAGENTIHLNTAALANGKYIIELKNEQATGHARLLIAH